MTPVSEAQEPKDTSLFNVEQAVKDIAKSDIDNIHTYEVPTYISKEKVEGGKDKKEGFNISYKAMKIGAAIIAAITIGAGGTFFGFMAANNNKNNGGKVGIDTTPTEDSITSTTNETESTTIDSENLVVTVAPSETTEQTAETTSNNPELFSDNIEYLKPTKTLEEMKAIDNIEDWAKLSPVDRAAYFIMTNTVYMTGISANKMNSYTKEHSFDDSMSIFALGEINNITRGAFLSDGIEAAKLTGAEYYYTETSTGEVDPAYKSTAEWMMSDQADQNTYNYGKTMDFVSAGTPNQLTNDSLENNPINYTNITYAQKTMSTGEMESAKTVQMIVVPIQLENGEKVIWFMRGYGVDGKDSPVENMPY